MKERRSSRLGTAVSEIGFGAWAIGGTWGEVSESDAEAALNAALDSGVTFIDTANVYGAGRSETIIGRVLKARGGTRPFVATKTGREGTNSPTPTTRRTSPPRSRRASRAADGRARPRPAALPAIRRSITCPRSSTSSTGWSATAS